MVLPVMSRMGHISRPRKRSYTPRWPSETRPLAFSSASVKPRLRSTELMASQPSGAKPTPKRSAAARSKPRSARNRRPTSDAGAESCSR